MPEKTAATASTTLGLHQQDAEKMNAIIETMTGEATEWVVDHGHYLGLSPVTNMDNVEINFYSKHVRVWGDNMTEEQMDDLRAKLKRSRRWKYTLVQKD
tara:strand:+ start:336 stop:632 length:297 start_codon:yes stop_codon:yes gene_type:complete